MLDLDQVHSDITALEHAAASGRDVTTEAETLLLTLRQEQLHMLEEDVKEAEKIKASWVGENLYFPA